MGPIVMHEFTSMEYGWEIDCGQVAMPSSIKPIQAPAYVPNAQMRQAMERLKGMATPITMTSKVSNYRQMGE